MPEQSILDVRLAEIDRRLRTIQSGLVAAEDPGRPAVDDALAAPSPPAPTALRDELAEAGRLVARLHELTAAHERLLASARERVSASSGTLAEAALPAAESAGSAPATVGLAAGPFADTAALRRFQAALAALPEVRSVTVREYSGADRVVLDVQLSPPRS